jgi:hypothetical protein
MQRFFAPIVDIHKINNAIHMVKDPYEFKLVKLDRQSLCKIARITNSAALHYSGNCSLLARVLLYNLKNEKTILSANNTHPFYRGMNSTEIEKRLFCREFQYHIGSNNPNSFDTLPNIILERYRETGERAYVIDIAYEKLEFELGHSFNAVITGEPDKLKIYFVDAWKSFKHTYTLEQLKRRYPHPKLVLLSQPTSAQNATARPARISP